MFLSALIFFPLTAAPTLIFLKKDFQLKLFYFLVTAVHTSLSVWLLVKNGYLFKGSVLQESIMLNSDLGLSYAVSLEGYTLLLALFANFLFLIPTLFSIRENTKQSIGLLFGMQILSLALLFSQNILLSFLLMSLLFFTSLIFAKLKKEDFVKLGSTVLLSSIVLIGVSLIFSILYESVSSQVDLSLKALSSMQTPFIKGSLFSTQFVLFVFCILGFFIHLLAICSFLKKIMEKRNYDLVYLVYLNFILSLVVITKFLVPLFPEASKFYLEPVLDPNILSVSLVGTLIFINIAFVIKNKLSGEL